MLILLLLAYIYIYPAHAQGINQSVVCRHENRQISSSRHLCVLNYHRLVDISEKLVSVCFELLNMAH